MKNIYLKKIINGILIFQIVFLFSCSSLYQIAIDDSLYKYQWALKNDGSLTIDKSKISISSPIDVLFKYDTELANDEVNDFESFTSIENIDVEIERAWQIYDSIKEKHKITVAVIDTGIDINHFELKNGIFTNKNEIEDGIDDDDNGFVDDICGWNFYDDNNQVFEDGIIDCHGTHVVGQIVAEKNNGGIKGICDNNFVQVLPIKILGKNQTGDTQNLIEAIKYAEKMGASICNISLGTYEYNEELEVVVKNSNMLFVVACGNGLDNVGFSTDKYKTYPASFNFSNVISVGNLMFDGRENVSSNYGSETVTLFAPGTYILSTIPNDCFAFQTGSSMAAPIVTGVASMVMTLNYNFNAEKVKEIICKNVKVDSNLSDKCSTSGYLCAGAIFDYIVEKY